MSQQLFWIFLLSGLILAGAEIFVPGGLIGTLGALALLAAIVAGFTAYPGYGALIALGIFVLVGVAIILWIRIFPRTRMGRHMTVFKDLSAAKSSDDANALLGAEGTAVSQLRPAGFALINGNRLDVVSSGAMISEGDAVRVVEVEGNRIVVARIAAPAAGNENKR